MEEQDLMGGAFGTILTRDNKSIKRDRAKDIVEESEMAYKRRIENMEVEVRRLNRRRDVLLDLSPGNTYSLMLTDKFDSEKFVDEDIQIGVDIKILTEKITIAKARYEYLFVSKKKPEAVAN